MLELPKIGFNIGFITLVVLGVALLIQLIYIIFFYFRLAIHKNKGVSNDDLPPVTVIICARNEEDNLYENLPTILEQNYAEYEVIVVNHQSIDDSIHILKAYARQYPHLKLIDIEKNKHLKNSKKLPLTIGIKGASYDRVLLTDADCIPNSKNWIKEMIASSTEEKPIVLGYGPYKKYKGLLNKFIRFDTSLIAINYFSYAKNGVAYMGIGRNLSYTQKLFNRNSGFKSHYELQSGDDDLFIQEVARKKNYVINFNEEATVYSEPKKTWKTWVAQKQRHFTTAPKYKVIHKALLGTYNLSLALMYISFAILLVETDLWLLASAAFGLRMLLAWIVNGVLLSKLKQKDLIIWFPFFELFHLIMMPFIYYTKQTSTTWK